jgi:putative ABC transport system permease protein
VSYPLTRGYVGASGPSHYLVIPWLEIAGLVILLPLLTAAIVGLAARSRLPLVARLD